MVESALDRGATTGWIARQARLTEPAILAEGEFDAMLLWQEVGDLIGVATLGSCNRGLSARALRYLLGCPRLLVAYDVDAEGKKGAERLGQLSPRMRRVRPPVGKDMTAFWQAGGRVRDWAALELACCKTGVRVTSIGSRHSAPPPARASIWAGLAFPLNDDHPVAAPDS